MAALSPALGTSGSSDVGWLVETVLAALSTRAEPFADAGAIARLRAATFADLVAAAEVVASGGASHPASNDRARSGGGDVLLYRSWLAVQSAPSPLLFAAHFNLGVALAAQGRREEAMVAYRNALAVRPEFAAAAINLGLLLEGDGQPDAALRVWSGALQPTDMRVGLLNHRARLQEQRGFLEEAETILRESLLADPGQPDAIQHFVHIRQKTCRWPAVPCDIPGLPADTLHAHAGPLGTLALTDDVAAQREANARWLARKTTPTPVLLAAGARYGHARARIGYLSSDFCRHAMSYLIAELLERHDRAQFEVYGYCSTIDDASPIRQRILGAFDHVRMVRDLSDEAAARAIRADEIDILVDLNGLTRGSRIQVLRWKPAPIQATYLGFIGPVPLPELDYMFCDDFVVPPASAGDYAPTPLAIGKLFQANDSRREIAAPMSRAEAGVPADAFVFCCFSNHYKIKAEMFAAWLAILRQSPGAVLWLNADSAAARANLAATATAAGIDATRLVFAERVDPARYMARLSCADLFLDTFPYNAGTIASDALRMGLPLLTLAGRSFASRMAARALLAIGAHAGITTTIQDYVARATMLANDRTAHAAFRGMVTREAWERTLGDAEAFTRAYERTLLGLLRTPHPTPDGVAAGVAHLATV